MALRQNIPDVSLGDGLFPADMQVVKRMRPPVACKFRYGGDLRELLEVVRTNAYVAVEAAVGAGKSTRLPAELSKEFGELIIQVLPNDFLAWDLSDYVKSKGVVCEYREDPAASWPAAGVVFVSAAGLVAHWLHLGKIELPKCILFHDEKHESDAYTAFLKGNALSIPGVQKYVTATATSGPGEYRSIESGGTINRHRYSSEMISAEWDLDGQLGMPWEITSIHDNILIFEDDKSNAERMLRAYNLAGFDTFRLHARMKLEQFKCAMAMARAKTDIVVLIADSTFRSGFTMPVSTLVDTAVVSMYTVDNGITVKAYRDAYVFECHQAANRVSRVKGMVSDVWMPEVKLENKMVVLEDTDADALVLLYRAFGRLCPREYLDSPLSEGKVPRNLISALKGYSALTTLHENLLAEPHLMGSESGRRSPLLKPDAFIANKNTLDYENPAFSADVARNYQKSADGGWERRTRSDSGYAESAAKVEKPVTAVPSIGDAIGAMMVAAVVEDIELVEGGYYCAPAMPAGTLDYSPMFPEGHLSVVRMLTDDNNRALHFGMVARDRWVAVNSLLMRLNIVSCELNGAMSVTRDLGSLAKERDPVAVREWVAVFMSRVGEMQADSRVLIDCIMRVSHKFCEIRSIPYEFMREQESQFANHMISGVRMLPLRALSLEDVYAGSRGRILEGVPDPVLQPAPLRLTDGHVDRGPTVLGTVNMPKVGRGMRGTSVRKRVESNPMRLARWFVT